MPPINILLLTGESGSGKTSVLAELIKDLDNSGVNAGGILAPGRFLDSGDKEFDLELIPDGRRYFLSTRNQNPGWQAIGGFRFNPEALEAGLDHLLNLHQRQFHVYLLDEIGPFELDDLVWAPAIPELIRQQLPMIWTVRRRLVDQVCHKWKVDPAEIISIDNRTSEEVLKVIGEWLKRSIQS
jgi:nucleoside-triphosphatase THEP1